MRAILVKETATLKSKRKDDGDEQPEPVETCLLAEPRGEEKAPEETAGGCRRSPIASCSFTLAGLRFGISWHEPRAAG